MANDLNSEFPKRIDLERSLSVQSAGALILGFMNLKLKPYSPLTERSLAYDLSCSHVTFLIYIFSTED